MHHIPCTLKLNTLSPSTPNPKPEPELGSRWSVGRNPPDCPSVCRRPERRACGGTYRAPPPPPDVTLPPAPLEALQLLLLLVVLRRVLPPAAAWEGEGGGLVGAAVGSTGEAEGPKPPPSGGRAYCSILDRQAATAGTLSAVSPPGGVLTCGSGTSALLSPMLWPLRSPSYPGYHKE